MTRLFAAAVTRKAKHSTGNAYRFTTETGNDCFLTRVLGAFDTTAELRVLNHVARYLRGQGYESTVVSSGGTYQSPRARYMVKTVDLDARQERIDAAADARAAALDDAAAEVAAAPAISPAAGVLPTQAEVAETADELMARVLTEHPSVARKVARAEERARYEEAATAREASAAYAADREQITRDAARQAALIDAYPENIGRPRRTGPSPEAVRTAVAQFQRELTAAAPAIGRIMSEPLPGEEEVTARARRAAAAAEQAQQAAAAAAQEVRLRAVAHYEALAEQALAARLAADAAWEEEAHAAGFATGADYGEYLVAETADVPEPDAPEPAAVPAPRLCAYCSRSALPGEAECEEHLTATDALPLAGVASTDSHRSPAPATLPCYHVTTVTGEVYGVAATSVRDALRMTQDRLSGEGSTDLPKGARRVGRWAASYGTVLHY